jgi:DNA-binding winged helix-turn-helix (wHTH) protein/serine/threonine protein kinase
MSASGEGRDHGSPCAPVSSRTSHGFLKVASLEENGPQDVGARTAGRVWSFADCEYDERRHELRVRGLPVELEVKPLAILQQLLLHAGEVVTKAELLDAVWPGVSVVEGSLTTAVSKLRRALGDENAIHTVPRVGYKLTTPVRCTLAPRPAPSPATLEGGQSVPGRPQWILRRRLDQSVDNEVWLAEHAKTREPRVFKFAPDDERLRALRREVTVARLLRDALGDRPDFVRLLEWNLDSPPYFVESEYGGPNLLDWAEARGGLEYAAWDVRLGLMRDVARAVAAAHGLDLLHRDLKPANILVGEVGGALQVKIADFGSASLLVPERLAALGITNQGFTRSAGPDADRLTGTIMYIAPEVLGGQVPTAASDVYALGVLLYQLVVGDFRRPFAPGWEAGVGDPVLREDIALAASGDPARRLQTAAVLVERLDNLDVRRQAARDRQLREAATQRRRRWSVAAAALAAVAVAGASLWPRAPATAPLTTVAVLPFRNLGSDAGVDFFRVALPDQIATALSRSPGLAVRPFAAASRFSGRDVVDVKAVGNELRADSLVTGHFLKTDDGLRIALEAIDTASEEVVWRDIVDAPANSMLAAQVQVALRVNRGLIPALGSTARAGGSQPTNEEAYQLFLRSLTLSLDPSVNEEGLALLERAVELDPGFARAWVLLSRRYYVKARYASGDASLMERYEAALERAVAADPADVSAAAGLVLSRTERGDLIEAAALADGLVRRRPDSVDAHFVLSYVLRFAGLVSEAAQHCETAFYLDPQTQTSGLRSCAILFFVGGDYPRALNYVNLDRGSDFAKAMTLDVLARQGKTDEALALGSPAIPQWPTYDLLVSCLAGQASEGRAAAAASIPPSADPEANYLAAAHLAYCGQLEAARDRLKRAIGGHYCSYPAIETDRLFERLRADASYPEIRAAAVACRNAFLAGRPNGS